MPKINSHPIADIYSLGLFLLQLLLLTLGCGLLISSLSEDKLQIIIQLTLVFLVLLILLPILIRLPL